MAYENGKPKTAAENGEPKRRPKTANKKRQAKTSTHGGHEKRHPKTAIENVKRKRRLKTPNEINNSKPNPQGGKSKWKPQTATMQFMLNSGASESIGDDADEDSPITAMSEALLHLSWSLSVAKPRHDTSIRRTLSLLRHFTSFNVFFKYFYVTFRLRRLKFIHSARCHVNHFVPLEVAVVLKCQALAKSALHI